MGFDGRDWQKISTWQIRQPLSFKALKETVILFFGATEISLNTLSPLHLCVRLSLTEEDEARQYSRLHPVQCQTQAAITKRGKKRVENYREAWETWGNCDSRRKLGDGSWTEFMRPDGTRRDRSAAVLIKVLQHLLLSVPQTIIQIRLLLVHCWYLQRMYESWM